MRRGRIEIMVQILAFCIKAKRKTRSMYQTNLSYAQLETYITLLASKNLLAHNSDSYVTTDKGHCFLKAFAQFNEVLEDHAPRAFVKIIHESYKEVEIAQIGRKDVPKDLKKMLLLFTKQIGGENIGEES